MRMILKGWLGVLALLAWTAAGAETETPPDAPAIKPLRIFTHQGPVLDAAFSHDGQFIVSGDNEKLAYLWSVADGREVRRFAGHTGEVATAALAPDGKTLISGSYDRTAILWDAASGAQKAQIKDHTATVFQLACSPDGRWLATGSEHEVLITPLDGTLSAHKLDGTCEPVCFAPDSSVLLTKGQGDGQLLLWSLKNFSRVKAIALGENRTVWGCAFAPDGRTVILGLRENVGLLVERASGRICGTLEGHTNHVRWAAVSPDGRRIATASWDQSVGLWDAWTGESLGYLKHHQDLVLAVDFSKDGRYLLSAARDQEVALWDLAQTRAPESGKAPDAAALEAAWQALAGEDAPEAYRAVLAFTRAGESGAALLGERLRLAAIPELDAAKVRQKIAELDHDDFDVRSNAMSYLRELGAAAVGELKTALAAEPALELKTRLNELLAGAAVEVPISKETLRAIRAQQALERIGSAAARAVLERQAAGAPDAPETADARDALRRLDARK